MKELTVLAVGKLRDPGLRKLCDDYYRRCKGRFQVREVEVRDNKRLAAALPAGGGKIIMLDERGDQLTSKAFSEAVSGWVSNPAGSPTLVIGGADGLGDDMRKRASRLLSLGKITLAHRLVRVVLAEQLYRAVSIMEGSPYHREG